MPGATAAVVCFKGGLSGNGPDTYASDPSQADRARRQSQMSAEIEKMLHHQSPGHNADMDLVNTTEARSGRRSSRSSRDSADLMNIAERLSGGGVTEKRAKLKSISTEDTDGIRMSHSDDSMPLGLFSVSRYRRSVKRLMQSSNFDFMIGLIIFCNSIMIGLEQSAELEDADTTPFQMMENIFLSIYVIELALRFFAFRLSCLEDNWVKFDLFLVVIGIITHWILPPLLGEIEQLGPLMVLRTARLARLARTVRLLIKFRELWMLVRGMINSGSTMVYTLFMLCMVVYIFSCMSIEIITNHALAKGSDADPEFQGFVNEHFRNLPLTMMTLIQFVTLDNMNLVYMPLVRKCWWLSFFFIAIILVVSLVLTNLITAVVVNSALEQAMQDREAMKAQEDKRKKRLMKDLRRLFYSLDDDQSGCVSKEEMAEMSPEDKAFFDNFLGTSDPMEVFKQLDVDDSGHLEIDEFCDGIWQVVAANGTLDIKRLEKQMSSIKGSIHDSLAKHAVMQERLEALWSFLCAKRNDTSIDAETLADGGDCLSPGAVSMSSHFQTNLREKKLIESPRLAADLQSERLAARIDNLSVDFDTWRSSISVELQEATNRLQMVLLEVFDKSVNAIAPLAISGEQCSRDRRVRTEATPRIDAKVEVGLPHFRPRDYVIHEPHPGRKSVKIQL